MTVKSLILHLQTLDPKLEVHTGGAGGKITKVVKADYAEGSDPKKAKKKSIVVLVGV